MKKKTLDIPVATDGMIKPLRLVVFALLFAPVLWAVCQSALNLSGFCRDEARWLQNDEYVFHALKRAVVTNNVALGKSNSDIQSFMKYNPSCCRILAGHSQGFISRVLGLSYLDVQVVLRLDELEIARAPNEGPFYRSYMSLNSCGSVVEYSGSRKKEQNTNF
jgi:hypothetical protein